MTAWLTAQGIRYELLPDKSVVRFCEGTEASGTLQAYVTNLGVIVFEACPEWTVPEPLRWQVIESAYMAFANWGLAEYGSYQIDPTNGRLTYRAALDCQGCQKDGISRIALDNLFAGFVRAAPRIADFRYVGQLVMCEEEIDGRVQPFARYLSLKELIERISATALAKEEARERYLDSAEHFFRDLGGVLNGTEV